MRARHLNSIGGHRAAAAGPRCAALRRLSLLAGVLLLATPAAAEIAITIEVLPELELTNGGGTAAHRCDDPTDVCPAPTNVLLSATKTRCTQGECDDPFRDLTYAWDFGDPGAGTWRTDGRDKNKDWGPFVSHVYETPGTHVVTLTVTDPSGVEHTRTVPVYISDANQVWPPGVTTCATNSGASDVDFSWCPYTCDSAVNCVCTNSSDPECDVRNSGAELTEMINSQIGAGKKRILIAPGETWKKTQISKINSLGSGPGLIASAGGAANPVNWDIDVVGGCTHGGGMNTLTLFEPNAGNGAGNWRWADINIDFTRVDTNGAAAAGDVYKCSGQGCYNNFLWLRSSVNDACTFWMTQHDWGNTNPPYAVSGDTGVGSHLWFVGDDTLMDNSSEGGNCNIGGGGDETCGYGMYNSVRYMVVQGLQFGSEDDGEETRWSRNRFSAGDGNKANEGLAGYYVIQHNQFEHTISGSVTLRSHVNAIHEYFNISDNYFATTAYNNIMFANSYNGVNAGPGLQDALVERNVINGIVEEEAISRRLTIRNNVFGPTGYLSIACGRGGQGKEGWSDDYVFANNSFYGTNRQHGFFDRSCGGEPNYAPDIVCRNNVLWDTASPNARACNLPTRWQASSDAYDNNAGRNPAETLTIGECPFAGADGACGGFDFRNWGHWELNDASGAQILNAGASTVGTLLDFANRLRTLSSVGAMESDGTPLEFPSPSDPGTTDPLPQPSPVAAPLLYD